MGGGYIGVTILSGSDSIGKAVQFGRPLFLGLFLFRFILYLFLNDYL